jgi:hypothetical protein
MEQAVSKSSCTYQDKTLHHIHDPTDRHIFQVVETWFIESSNVQKGSETEIPTVVTWISGTFDTSSSIVKQSAGIH